MSPEIARKVVQRFWRPERSSDQELELTPQEINLLRLLVEGASYQTAATSLGISINTVRNYIRSVYEKLHVHTKSAAVGKALRERLI